MATHVSSLASRSTRLSTAAAVAALLVGGASCSQRGAGPQQARVARPRARAAVIASTGTVNLTAQRMNLTLRDGSTAPMWGFCDSASAACTAGAAWAPGPTIVAPAGSSLTINLQNGLPVPTSLVILGQLGGGLGSPTTMASPPHPGQAFTTFPGNSNTAAAPFVPPAQGPRVRSFGTEVPAAGSAALSWASLKPGTYLYETGTLPSLQVPMGLYGVLVVTTPPAAGVPGTAYPGIGYDDEAALLFSEVDPVQNRAVDAAAVAGTDVSKRFNDPTCFDATTGVSTCYPAAVNYTPTYFLINGQTFDRTAPQNSTVTVGDTATYSTGNVLVRLLNAGSRSHVPSLVGLDLALVAEDGNPSPGKPHVQSEALLTAGKTLDALVRPVAAGTAYAPATYPVFDRSLYLSTDNHPDGGMQGYLLVNHAAAAAAASGTCSDTGAACSATSPCATGTCVYPPVAGAAGNLPVALTAAANADGYNVPYNGSVTANVTANDVGITRVALGTAPASGTVTLAADGSFTYRPGAGFSGTDSFTYVGNGNAALTATVTLQVAALLTGAANMPVAADDAFQSTVATSFAAPRPGVLANDTDPNAFPLSAGPATAGAGCASVSLQPDGAFSATASAGAQACTFTYADTNSQGNASNTATVTVTFGTPSGLSVAVVDASTGAAITDYRWTLQEDLTFKHATGATPSVDTRTVGTSFHRSHMPVVATGCVGPTSCGSGQTVRGVAVPASPETSPASAVLDPTRRYYVSILPGDGSPPGHAMGGAEIARTAAGTWAPVTVRLQAAPLVTSQMSIYIYEDSNPTNGANEPTETPLGGFNIILVDPAGRTGDVAGQQTYDAFNMPLSNYLLGRPGCPDELNASTNGAATGATGNTAGVVYTCPNPPPGYTGDPARYALAGHALVQNLTPARYDVIAHPGAAREQAGERWWQTETLEGTPAQDAFVGVNEPVYFQEFGPPGPHVTIGFVNPDHVKAFAQANGLVGTATVTGKVTNQHMSRPSNVTLWDAGTYDLFSATTCQVALNSTGGTGPAIAAAECAPDGSFSLAGIPPGTYDLAVFDQWLDQIIQNVAVTVPPATAAVDLGNLPELSWFTQHDQNIFMDLNRNGIYDAGEPGISNVPLTVRYRNGAPSNATLSDSAGNGILVELFPLFNWYVAEADTTRYKQTGVHITVDGGGKPDTTGDGAGIWTSTYPTGESSVRTEIPGALFYGTQGFISQRNRIDWGRAPYAQGENGGIVGTVVYSSTRPFDDMRFNLQTIWEPLVPRVTVNLYQQVTLPDGTRTLKLVDTTRTSSFDDFVNLVYGADGAQYLLGSDGNLRDPVTGALAPAGAYPAGRQVNLQCPGQLPGTTAPPPWNTAAVDPFTSYVLGGDQFRCYDGFHDWNQVQAAPYDGRYAFPSPAYVAAHPLTAAQQAAGQTLVSLPPGTYVVEAVTPPGYQVVKEEDKNILIGDTFTGPAPAQFGALASIFILPDQATLGNANPYNPSTGDPGFQSDPTTNLGVYTTSTATEFPECVGNLHRVPDYLSLYPQAQQVAPFAGMDRPLCDRKQVVLNDQMQSAAFFFVFTEVPVASNNTGIVLDDATSEFNALNPDFGEKASVPFVPVSVRDWSGLETSRTYTDQWGAYNMMTPSSWLVNPPTPSGYGPNMTTTCINDPGPILDTRAACTAPGVPAGCSSTAGQMITDPSYNPSYSNFCYTFPYMPGQTTYLDTPVVPIAAFAAGYNPPDCALPDQAPMVKRVDGAGVGPWLPAGGGTLTITAQGDLEVLNPAYGGPFATSGLAAQRTVLRHYGFGATPGRLSIGGVDLTAATTWSDGTLTVAVPAGTPGGELSITTAAGRSTIDAVTVTIGGKAPTYVSAALGQTIQDAIDLAAPGDLIMVDAGTYPELLIMWKPVRLQGVGAGSVIINAAKYPSSKLEAWRPRVNALFNVDPVTGNQGPTSQVDPLPGQEITGGVVVLEPTVLGQEEGAGVTVLAKNLPATACGDTTQVGWESNFLCAESRIDGLSITGGDAGGGIYVNGWAHDLDVGNNRVYGNAGAYNGGIRVGVPYQDVALPTSVTAGRITGLGYDVGVRIHHNAVTRNGTVEAPLGNGGAGGGISMCSGSDLYSVDHNYVCGNYGASDGGGIGHLGFSQGGLISQNQVLFNQTFQQSGATHGGGIFVGGEPPVAVPLGLGSGDVNVDGNVIRGNFAEGGQGGGIRLQQVNGADVTAYPTQPTMWHSVTVGNNLVVDNEAGWAGGGISLADALNSAIVGNTIVSNDSDGIAGVVLAGGVPLPATTPAPAGVGSPSPAGVVSEPTSQALLNQLPTLPLQVANLASQPILVNDVIWQNRSFYYSGDGRICSSNDAATATTASCRVLADQAATGQCPAGAAYWEVGVLGDTSPAPGPVRLNPTFSTLSSTAGYAASNRSAAPALGGAQYCNGSRFTPELPGILNPYTVKNLQVAATLDEGNNYVNMNYGPLYAQNPVTGASFGDYSRLDSVTPAALDLFASLRTTTTGQVTFHNLSAGPLPVAISLIGANAGQFRQTNTCPASVPAGASCTVTVTFAPTVAAPLVKSASLRFLSTTPGATAYAALTGTILVPNLTFSPDPATLGARLRETSVAQPITVTNAGQGIAVLQAVSLTGANLNQFGIVGNTCLGSLAPGASCVVTVTFTPTSVNPVTKNAALRVGVAAPGTAQSDPLVGTVLIPAITLDPTAFGFGTQTVGSSTPQDFQLLNSGTGTLTVTGIAIVGANAGQFSQTSNCPGSLPAGASCGIVVTFRPTSLGAKSATLRVTGTVPAVTGTAALTGTGI